MKRSLPLLLSLPMLALPGYADLFLNGDFTNGPTSWQEGSGGGDFTFDYPATGGNPGGHGVIDNTAGGEGFGLLVTDGGEITTLSSLGLTAGQTYRFSHDMIRFSGPNLGGFKVDFFSGTDPASTPSTGDLFPEPIGGGDSWQTYDYLVTIPADADGLKGVLLWGADSSVGFDNVQVDTTPLATDPIPNNDFSQGSFAWTEIGDQTTWSYPTTGGNPGAYGVMTNAGAGFGIWVANQNQPIKLADLGLEPGTTALFRQDMIVLSGENVGGLKIDFFNGGAFVNTTGDLDPEIIGDGSTWETYTFPVDIPAEIDGIPVDGIKLVPLEGLGSSVGYDNFRVRAQPALVEASPEGTFVEGTIVSWSPTNPDKIYQPQRSVDGFVFTSFGPGYPGVETTSLLDPNPAPFYRVIETDLPGENFLINGGFETADFLDPDCAEGWQCLSPTGQNPTRITDDAFSGDASIRIAVQNDDTPTANQAEIQQNLEAAGGFVIPGETYTLSFWAKQIAFGETYVQRYRLQWFGVGGPLAENQLQFTDFVGGDNVWSQTLSPPITAPAAATGALIQIFGSTGAVPSANALGEVLLDEVALIPGSAGEPTVLETTETPGGVGIYLQTRVGQFYQAEVTDNLDDTTEISGVFPGNGAPAGAGTVREGDKRFYLFREIEEGD